MSFLKQYVPAVLVAALAGVAHADYTHVNAAPGTEHSVSTILNNLYNTSFVMGGVGDSIAGSSSGSDGSGSLTITRVQDFILGGGGARLQGANLELAGTNLATATDQVWIDGIVDAQSYARFAGYGQDFGYYAGDGTGGPDGFSKLFTLTGSQYNVSGSSFFNTDDAGDLWRWVRGTGPYDQGNEYSSREADNSDQKDHMITFFIDRATGNDSWFVFFEDLVNGGDQDFNDLGVELEVLPIVPLPQTAGLAAAGLLVVGVRRRRA